MEFVKKCNELNYEDIIDKVGYLSNDFDYSLQEYPMKHWNNMITIRCIKHDHIFKQNLYNQLYGYSGCNHCAADKKKATKEKKTKKFHERFITSAKEIHNGFYDYSKTTYIGRHKKLTITCPKHGEFEQTAGNHLNGQGCWDCRNDKISTTAKNTHHLNDTNKHLPCIMYYVKLTVAGKEYYKIGITRKKSVRKRFSYEKNESIYIISEFRGTYEECVELEELILEEIKERKYRCHELQGVINGWTECFRDPIEISFHS